MYQSLLAKIGRTLDAAGISYMVIGGQAVLLHGEPRLTRDIDITLGVDATHLARVRSSLLTAGLESAVSDVETFVGANNVYPAIDRETSIRVDLIFSFTPYESEAIRRAVTAELDGVLVRFAAAEDLIIHKLVAGRPRDIEDVRGVLARSTTLDEQYLHSWLASFTDVVHRDLVSEFSALSKQRPESGGDS